MQRARNFLSLNFLAGAIVLLPVSLFFLLLQWLLAMLGDTLRPLTGLVSENLLRQEQLAFVIVLALLLVFTFFTGLLVRTELGNWLQSKLDSVLVRYAPGYRTIRDLVGQLASSRDNNVFKGEPVLAYIYGRDIPVTVTALVTSRNANGTVTVYVPTAPIPTSGMTYHLPADSVDPLPNVSVEEAMRTIVACGSGMDQLLVKAGKAH